MVDLVIYGDQRRLSDGALLRIYIRFGVELPRTFPLEFKVFIGLPICMLSFHLTD